MTDKRPVLLASKDRELSQQFAGILRREGYEVLYVPNTSMLWIHLSHKAPAFRTAFVDETMLIQVERQKLLSMVSDKAPWPVNEGTPRFRRIHLSHISARQVHYAAAFIYGLPEMPVPPPGDRIRRHLPDRVVAHPLRRNGLGVDSEKPTHLWAYPHREIGCSGLAE